MERIPCRRCLLKDLSDTDYFHSIYEYIENIPPEQKAPDALYKDRLKKCTSCDHLVNGIVCAVRLLCRGTGSKSAPTLRKKTQKSGKNRL